MQLVFCTNNAHKVSEVSQIMGPQFEFLRLHQVAFYDEIPEPFDTLEANSNTKAKTVYERTGLDCFAEDTGLFIEALQGAPGVYSARYAGERATAAENNDKVLLAMQGNPNRRAYFKTVITLIISGVVKQFAGECHGTIITEKTGVQGFGYDPIFKADNQELTFAELSPIEKNAISHRKKAFDLFANYLKTLS
jgi:XTP/dITP diphosphohydrolase